MKKCKTRYVDWQYSVSCDKIADRITSGCDKTQVIDIKPDKVVLGGVCYNAVKKDQVKLPNFILNKVKAVYKNTLSPNSNGCVFVIYDNCNVYMKGKQERIGVLK